MAIGCKVNCRVSAIIQSTRVYSDYQLIIAINASARQLTVQPNATPTGHLLAWCRCPPSLRGSHCWLWGDRGDLAALLSQGRCPTRISLWWRRRRRRSPRKKMAQEPVGATSPWTPSWIISFSRIVHMFVTKKHWNKYISCTSPLSINYLKSCSLVPNLFLSWDED